MTLSPRANTLALQSSRWVPDFSVQSQSVESDPSLADSIKVELAFDSLATIHSGSAEVVTDLEIVMANSIYTFNICALYSLPTQGVQMPINVFLRQRQYPYKKLTESK